MRSIQLTLGIVAAAAFGATQPAHAQSAAWSGPYIGINGGGGWGSSSQTDTVIPQPPAPAPAAPAPVVQPAAPLPKPKPQPPSNPADGQHGVSGALIGGGAGYNYVMGSVLAGIEGDIDWSGIDGESVSCGGDHECGASLKWVATVRGRLGMIVHGTTLVYATGGLALGDINAYDLTVPGFSSSKTKAGWTVGAGVEHQLGGAWSAKLEYLYMDFGKAEYFTITDHTPEVVGLDVHTVRLGINYKLCDCVR